MSKSTPSGNNRRCENCGGPMGSEIGDFHSNNAKPGTGLKSCKERYEAAVRAHDAEIAGLPIHPRYLL